MSKINNKMLSVLKIVAYTLLSIIVAIFLVFVVLGIFEYKPEPVEKVFSESNTIITENLGNVPQNKEIKFLTWNVGYGALGDNADFFMDGGKHVYTSSAKRVQENIACISEYLKQENVDFYFLQEVDVKSARSYRINEKEYFASDLPEYDYYFGTNFNAIFVPIPFPPIGKVHSGIQTLSRYKIEDAERVSLPCPFKIPSRFANLKRCILVNRLKVQDSNKELVLINVHLEAYDSGEGKIAQTKVLKKIMDEELSKGNYVIVGGDFNQTFSNVVLSEYPHISDKLWRAGLVNVANYSKEFSFHMDNTVPTCRSLDKPYTDTLNGISPKKDFQFYMIDGFIVSSNVNVKSVQTIDKNFVNSDHNPVKMIVELN